LCGNAVRELPGIEPTAKLHAIIHTLRILPQHPGFSRRVFSSFWDNGAHVIDGGLQRLLLLKGNTEACHAGVEWRGCVVLESPGACEVFEVRVDAGFRDPRVVGFIPNPF
jgi:hypothetical protein